MTAKDWMLRAWRLQDEIDALNKARQTALDRMTHITPSYDSSGGTSTPDPHKFDYIAAYVAQIDERQRKLVDVQTEILNAINRVSNPQIRSILLARYINCERFETIAYRTGVSWRHAVRLHGYGLLEIKNIVGL